MIRWMCLSRAFRGSRLYMAVDMSCHIISIFRLVDFLRNNL